MDLRKKTFIKIPNQSSVICSFLISLYIFEFITASEIIPAYLIFRFIKLVLAGAAAAYFILNHFLKRNGAFLDFSVLAIFFALRIYEVLKVVPRIHEPGILMSLVILAAFISVFIYIYSSQFMSGHYMTPIAFCCAVVYQLLYFRKLHDLSPIFLILTLTSTTAITLISWLLRTERYHRIELRRLYEEEIELRNKLALMRGKMLEQEKGFSMSMMTAGIAHELGNPINYLQGNLSYLKKHIESLLELVTFDGLTEEQRKLYVKVKEDYQSIINHSMEGFANITDVLTNMKKLYGSSHRGTEKTNIRELVSRTVQFFKTSFTRIDYIIETDNEADLFARINQGEYYIVLTNLLNNAAESFDNSRKIPNIIRVEISSENRWIRIRITDNGRGISTENRQRIFDPFFSTKETRDNLGLGLALCAEIIRSDGNEIEIESEPGRGTTVTISIREDNGEHNKQKS